MDIAADAAHQSPNNGDIVTTDVILFISSK
jgi:hypothetical protein